MGFQADEMQALLRAGRLGPGTPGADYWRPIYEAAYERSRPVREVDVRAFLCARAPLVDRHVASVDRGLCLGEPFTEARRASDAVPAFVGAAAAERLLRHFGARLPSEEEWEYVAREGGASHRGKTYADWHRGTSDLHAHPAFAPLAALVPREEAEDEIDALAREEEEAFAEEHLGEGFHALGVWGLEFGEWVAGPEARHRGGGVLHYPWQDSPEVLSAHPANRGEGGAFGDLATARPVLDLR